MTIYDIIIENGLIIDGTRTPRYRADLGITGDKITAIGDLSTAEAASRIDAAGKIVAPGFVDVHTHMDGWLLTNPHLHFKTLQGFTTEILMADGISYAPVNTHTAREWMYYLRALTGLRLDEYTGWESLADYMALLDGHNVQNVMTHIPYANLRVIASGWGQTTPDDFAIRHIQTMVAQGMDEGAVGLSTGMDYIAECFATTDELVLACQAMSAQRGLYVTHVRYKRGTLAGVQEAVEIGRRANVPVHISHLKANTVLEAEAIINYIDRVAVHDVDFSFDVYPYVSSSTMLNYILPYEVYTNGPLAALGHLNDPQVRARFAHSLELQDLDAAHIAWLPGRDNVQHIGKTLSAYVAEIGKSPADALADLLIEERLAVLLVFRAIDDSLVAPFLQHEKFMLGSDGIYFPESAVHPRVYGSSTRLLGHCVRDQQLFSLEEAVYKLSGYPASRFGMVNRGILREGAFADVVVFDPATINDPATYEAPHQNATGVTDVLVNGLPIIAVGQPIESPSDPLPGRYLRFNS
jgi:N-acyl-D-amino-acid deacylase